MKLFKQTQTQTRSRAKAKSKAKSKAKTPTTGRFIYEGYEIDPSNGTITCRYQLNSFEFVETFIFAAEGNWNSPGLEAAARLLFLVAGISYYKAGAPATIDLGSLATSDVEREFIRSLYINGLAEFCYVNNLDISNLDIQGPDTSESSENPADSNGSPTPLVTTSSDHAESLLISSAPLIPFGGGIDSIITVETLRNQFPNSALFIVSRVGDFFEAIENPAKVTGLPIVRAERAIDPQILHSRELGFLNGHVPVTAIISAMAVVAALLDSRDAVVMSNEWSASIPTLTADFKFVNHQWSKGLEFETSFRRVLSETVGSNIEYFSLLRPYSEFWIASRFASLTQYHDSFRSCNKAFHIEREKRLDHWCAECDKCCFIDLILSPFVDAHTLNNIFGGNEPLSNIGLRGHFQSLIGTSSIPKPFDCVGEQNECRAAVKLAAARPDRSDNEVLRSLLIEVDNAHGAPDTSQLLSPRGQHFIPDNYAPSD